MELAAAVEQTSGTITISKPNDGDVLSWTWNDIKNHDIDNVELANVMLWTM
jgi:hypothetical protein